MMECSAIPASSDHESIKVDDVLNDMLVVLHP